MPVIVHRQALAHHLREVEGPNPQTFRLAGQS